MSNSLSFVASSVSSLTPSTSLNTAILPRTCLSSLLRDAISCASGCFTTLLILVNVVGVVARSLAGVLVIVPGAVVAVEVVVVVVVGSVGRHFAAEGCLCSLFSIHRKPFGH